MIELDKKDLRILFQLDTNSRQSFSQIGRKIHLSKQVVSYRINRLQERGIIKNFYIQINPFKLGYIPIRFYLTFQFTTPDLREEIVAYIARQKCSWWIASLDGKYDLSVNILVKDYADFSNFWDEFLKRYRDFIDNEVFSIYFQLRSYSHSYLCDLNYVKNRCKYIITSGEKKEHIDDIDKGILNVLGMYPRVATSEIAEKLQVSIKTIVRRLTRLERAQVIQAFRVNIDLNKIGYADFKIDISLRDFNKRVEIINFIESHPNLVFVSKSAGISDIELEFHMKNEANLTQIIKTIHSRFPEYLRRITFHRVIKQHLWGSMPEI